jgi:hypothetical protein
MKRIHIGLILIICTLLVGLSFSSLFAEDFSFIEISWNDNLDTVKKKIDQSGLSSDKRWNLIHTESTPLNSIFKAPKIDEKRNRELTHIADKFRKDLRIEHQLKYIEFRGKRDSMVKNASFFFTYDRDILLAYSVSSDTSTVTSNARTGEGEVYQDLVKKYGSPTTTTEGSKVWSKNDQSLYYTPVNDAVIVTYISDSNLSNYIDRLEGKPKKSDEANPEKLLPGPKGMY